MSIEEGINYAGGFVAKFFDNFEPFRGKAIYFTGQLPYTTDDLLLLVPDSIVSADLERDAPDEYANPETAFVVVGYDNYSEDEITRYVNEMESLVAFLPQEGFIDLLFGYDWWRVTKQNFLLDHYLECHDGLKYVKSLETEKFQWPSTLATRVVGTGEGESQYMERTDLHEAGYSIYDGNRRRTDSERRLILTRIVSQEILSLQEVAEWIATLCKRYRREDKNTNAVNSYERDMAFLKKAFYDPLPNRFAWPSI